MKKMLFVEDDIITGSIYRRHFHGAGYEVELVDDGHQALAALARCRPDVVVLDLLLPKVDGVEVLKQIRLRNETKSLPVVVFTNVYASKMISAAEKAGANLCLHKAKTDPKTLIAAIDQIVHRSIADKTSIRAPVASSSKPEFAPTEITAADPHAIFLEQAPPTCAKLHDISMDLVKEKSNTARHSLILECLRKVRTLSAAAALAQAEVFAQVASAVEFLLRELHERPSNINSSTLRTVNHTVALLNTLFHQAFTNALTHPRPFKVLVVDDDPVSLKLVCRALERAQLCAEGERNPFAAVTQLQAGAYDLLIADLAMPGMNGFQLCDTIRSLPGKSNFPVIFVTARNSFSIRIRSAKSGANDFIAKPFLPIELTVKVLTQLLEERLNHSSPFHLVVSGQPH